MEKKLLTLFDNNNSENEKYLKFEENNNCRTLKSGEKYKFIDCKGNVRTISKVSKWNAIKFHFEKTIE